MIVTVRRWTSLALPRFKTRTKAKQSKVSERGQERTKRQSFLGAYNEMLEHQVNLMFREKL